MKTLYFLACLLLMLGARAASGQTSVPVALNLPATVSADIAAGATSVELPFNVSGADRLRFDLIVPVDGATLSVLDPAGTLVMTPGDPRLAYHPGNAQTPPLPGGVFIAEDLLAPANGVWRLRLNFPPAPGPTAVLGTVMLRSRYQAGIAIDRDTLLVGEDAAIGMLVLDDGKPLAGLAPQISIAGAAGIEASDDGVGPDGLAGDGVYSIEHVFSAPGTYTVSGTVSIPTADGPVQRSAAVQLKVRAPVLQLGAIDLLTDSGNAGCVAALRVSPHYEVLAPGRYTTWVRLQAPNGKSLDWRQSADYGIGSASPQARFDAADIRRQLASDGPYSVRRIDTLRSGEDQALLAFRRLDAGQFNLDLAELCAPAILLSPEMAATPLLRDGYIGALQLAFPVQVATAGHYQISFKLLGKEGADIQLINATRDLAAGVNQVSVQVDGALFQQADGPYRAVSLLVVAGANSARLAVIGSTEAWSRWQFYPARAGDLDGDGAVGAADQALLTAFRGQAALAPGDRRDLNRDGVIDLRDARLLQQQR